MTNTPCAIQWIDDDGRPTPDQNPAIGAVQCTAHIVQIAGRGVEIGASAWFPICADHAARLAEPGMEHWIFATLDNPVVTA